MIIDYPHEFRITEYYKKSRDEDNRPSIEIKGYGRYFADWINWCNAKMREISATTDVDSGEVDICFKFTEPEYSEDKKRWETYIYICTLNGRIFSFGYEPKKGSEGIPIDYKEAPSTFELPPTEESDKRKKKKITREQKKKDVLDAWESMLGDIRKIKQEEKVQNLRKEWDMLLTAKKEVEKSLRKYKKEKNKKMIAKYQKEVEKVERKILSLTNKIGKK